MKRILSKWTAVFLVAMSIFAIGVASAAAQEIEPRWNYTATIGNTLTISNNVANVNVTVRANSDMDRVDISTRLEKYVNGTWQNVTSFYKSSNSFYCLMSESYGVTKGYKYRISTTVWVYDKTSSNSYYLKETISNLYYECDNF